MVDFKMNNCEKNEGDSNTDHHEINARDFFVPTQVMSFLVVQMKMF